MPYSEIFFIFVRIPAFLAFKCAIITKLLFLAEKHKNIEVELLVMQCYRYKWRMKMRRIKILSLILAVVFITSASALADFTDYNMVVFDDFDGSVHVGGKAIVGGSVSGQLEVANIIKRDNTDTTLIVGGDISSGANVKVLAGNASIGGTIASGTVFEMHGNNKPSVTQNDSSASAVFNTIKNELAGTSSYFAGFGGTKLLTSQIMHNKLDLDTRGLDQFVYFDVSNDVLSYQNLELNLSADSTQTVVFNVTGNTIDFKAKLLGGFVNAPTYSDRIFWNFIDATAITLHSENFGSFIAQDAIVTTSSNFNGGVYVKGLSTDNTKEVHLVTYSGEIPTVPAPSAIFLASAGIAAVGRIRRNLIA